VSCIADYPVAPHTRHGKRLCGAERGGDDADGFFCLACLGYVIFHRFLNRQRVISGQSGKFGRHLRGSSNLREVNCQTRVSKDSVLAHHLTRLSLSD
jgi:hypothetical protein